MRLRGTNRRRLVVHPLGRGHRRRRRPAPAAPLAARRARKSCRAGAASICWRSSCFPAGESRSWKKISGLISKLGFNFVRLPMDYRFWIKDGDWEQFDEATLQEIDQAVAWGGKYGIHVAINFHRAPGYTVASPPEKTSLWTDPETQRVCAKHWAMFARRYRGIPMQRLSFNLMNEPAQVDAQGSTWRWSASWSRRSAGKTRSG